MRILGYVQVAGAVVGIDDSGGDDEEVISMAGAAHRRNRDHMIKLAWHTITSSQSPSTPREYGIKYSNEWSNGFFFQSRIHEGKKLNWSAVETNRIFQK